MSHPIFVFGSNLSGIHGAGAARYAVLHHGAVMGQGVGLHGNSYALPTKDHKIRTLHLPTIRNCIGDFINFALVHPEKTFMVTRVGCGLAGYRDSDIAPLFKGAPKNCQFDLQWKPYLGESYIYWGTQ